MVVMPRQCVTITGPGWLASSRHYEDDWAGPRPAPQRVHVSLDYDTGNPFQVRLRCDGHEAGPWVFDRALLEAAVAVDPAAPRQRWGEGNVQVGRVPRGVCFELDRGDPDALLVMLDANAAGAFVEAMHDAVPRGTEAYDVDSWIEQLRGAS